MIGELRVPSKPKLRPRPVPKIVEVEGAGSSLIGVIARDPCSDYNIKMLQYGQRKSEYQQRIIDSLKKDVNDDKYNMKFMLHSEKRGFTRDVNKKVEAKMKEYDENIERRKQKLLDLYWKEERENIKEVIDECQKGETRKLQDMRLRLEELKVRREEERQELARRKKLQQYVENSDEYRPLIAKINLHEARAGQKQQMKENEMKQECERELDRMWHNMLLKELEAMNEREKQDRLAREKMRMENKTAWALQLEEKKIQEQELQREKQEDFNKLNEIREELIREEIKNLDNKRRKRDESLKDFQDEIKKRKELLQRREQEEKSVVRAYEKLVVEEIEREKLQAKASADDARKEMLQFMEYIKRLEEERLEEERILDQLIEQSRKNIDEQQIEAKCKLEYARQALKEATLSGIAEQIEYKKKVAEEQLKKQKLENEVIKMNIDQNERLRAEYERQRILETKMYADDLKKQIQHKLLLKKREREELERQLQEGLVEEEKFRKIIESILTSEIKIGATHPFRTVLNEGACICPNARNGSS